MFSDIRADSSSRLVEVRQYLDFIKDNTPALLNPVPTPIVTSRGLFFVHLYGVYERTVREGVFRAIRIMNKNNHRVLDYKPLLLSIVLHSQCDAMAFSSKRNWEKRWNLFETLEANPTVTISEELLPTDGHNLRFRQLEMIWKAFAIADPIVPNPAIGGRIKELVDNRNAIAHGNATALEIGARVTIADLYDKYNDISGYCSYFLNTIESHVLNKAYLNKK